jgi:protein-S-isoprenylcysteine O-methyltransferase Ste14
MLHSGQRNQYMKAAAIQFRLRMFITLTIILLGLWAPWIDYLQIGTKIPLLEWLALQLSRRGLLSFSVAAPMFIVFGSLIAATGALLRIWGSAWLGPATVIHGQMQAGAVMADGPYRFVRNPLYLGLGCVVAALMLLMPPSGALFALVAMSLNVLGLTFGEEAFLAGQLGAPYQSYLRAVPRFIPRFRGAPPPTGRRPHWLRAILTELTPVGIFLAFACLSWEYDYRLMGRAILISFGVGLIGRAFVIGNGKDPGATTEPL